MNVRGLTAGQTYPSRKYYLSLQICLLKNGPLDGRVRIAGSIVTRDIEDVGSAWLQRIVARLSVGLAERGGNDNYK